MTTAVAIACVVLSVAGSSVWALWRWARGYDSITRSDHYERRNY